MSVIAPNSNWVNVPSRLVSSHGATTSDVSTPSILKLTAWMVRRLPAGTVYSLAPHPKPLMGQLRNSLRMTGSRSGARLATSTVPSTGSGTGVATSTGRGKGSVTSTFTPGGSLPCAPASTSGTTSMTAATDATATKDTTDDFLITRPPTELATDCCPDHPRSTV